jgi:hypothetical protein
MKPRRSRSPAPCRAGGSGSEDEGGAPRRRARVMARGEERRLSSGVLKRSASKNGWPRRTPLALSVQPLTSALVGRVDKSCSGVAAGVLNSTRQTGGVLGPSRRLQSGSEPRAGFPARIFLQFTPPPSQQAVRARRGRSGRDSSLWSKPPRNPSRTSPSSPLRHRLPRSRAAVSANRRSGRCASRST